MNDRLLEQLEDIRLFWVRLLESNPKSSARHDLKNVERMIAKIKKTTPPETK